VRGSGGQEGHGRARARGAMRATPGSGQRRPPALATQPRAAAAPHSAAHQAATPGSAASRPATRAAPAARGMPSCTARRPRLPPLASAQSASAARCRCSPDAAAPPACERTCHANHVLQTREWGNVCPGSSLCPSSVLGQKWTGHMAPGPA